MSKLTKLYHSLPPAVRIVPAQHFQFVLTVAAIVVAIVSSGVGAHLYLRSIAAKDSSTQASYSTAQSTTASASDSQAQVSRATEQVLTEGSELRKDAIAAPAAPATVDSTTQLPNTGVADDASMEATTLPENPTTAPSNTFGLTNHNHLTYPEADPTRLTPVGLFVRDNYEREEILDYEAAKAFNDMRAAANAEGISLMPVSGYRSVADQTELFVKQTEKHGSAEAAARLSAPPGHSEHHTGYAIDIADTNRPETDIKYSFADTPAYQWLIANAGSYGFEESFPENNVQGVSYEPWHWRYVGSERASATFTVSKTLYP